MLARLLRRLIFTQAAVGAALGYLLFRFANATPWSALVGAVLLPILTSLLVCLVTTIKSKADEPAAMWWRSVVGEFWAGILIFLLRQPWTRQAPRALPATGSTTQVPVVLVHGYICNHRVWDTVARSLRAQGHAVLAVNLEPLFTSIDNYAPTIEAAVDALCKQTGAPQVALVGHSMGGLAIRAWMRACGAQRAARVITLGTPHAGTQIEPDTRTPNGIQMGWHSTWLAELAASESADVRSRIHIAITPQDNIVYPQRAQVLPDLQATVFEGIGHLQMCLDASVIGWVGGLLKDLKTGASAA